MIREVIAFCQARGGDARPQPGAGEAVAVPLVPEHGEIRPIAIMQGRIGGEVHGDVGEGEPE